jgi:hypothetical protein
MATDETVPLTVTPEAAEYIDQHGVRAAFEQMVARIAGTVPGIRSIRAELPPQYDVGYDIITIEATTPVEGVANGAETSFDRWAIETFPSDVLVHFTFSVITEVAHGR